MDKETSMSSEYLDDDVFVSFNGQTLALTTATWVGDEISDEISLDANGIKMLAHFLTNRQTEKVAKLDSDVLAELKGEELTLTNFGSGGVQRDKIVLGANGVRMLSAFINKTNPSKDE
jgi:hypothetical protein